MFPSRCGFAETESIHLSDPRDAWPFVAAYASMESSIYPSDVGQVRIQIEDHIN